MGSEVIIAPAAFSTVGFVVWVVVSGWRRQREVSIMTEFNNRLLDRFGSLKDFSEFVQTEAGTRLMSGLMAGRTASPSRAQDAILRAIQLGIVLLSLGAGFLTLGNYFIQRYPGDFDFIPLIVIGGMALSLGVGFVLSAGASYRVAKALGVLDREGLGSKQV